MKKWSLATAFCWLVAGPLPSHAISIQVNDLTGGTQATALAAFEQAAGWWENLLIDPITIHIDFDFSELDPGVLGGTSSVTVGRLVSDVLDALALDATSINDATAVANLPAGPALSFRTNDANTSAIILDNNGTGNNVVLDVNRANAKALGLLAPSNTVDASIQFSTEFNFDFDPSDGITGGQFDFVGISAHEIGHALGFVSGVDIVDLTHGAGPAAPTPLDNFRVHSVLDLYRYSSASLLLGGPDTFDYATGGTPYFSIDGGATELARFSTGQFNGDGRQASHWKDHLGLGLMDPTAAPGELLGISALDILAFDVFGYDLQQAVQLVPEPSTWLLLSIGLTGLLLYSHKRKHAA